MVAKITEEFEFYQIYKVGNIKTNKKFRLSNGLSDQLYTLAAISNSHFSEIEYNQYRLRMSNYIA